MTHRAKPKWCEYGERRFYARSRAEANHAAVLEMQRKAGAILDWRHEPRRYLFPNRTVAPCFFLPDFEVTALDGSKHLVEVKGRWQTRDRSRVILMARHYPDVEVRFVGAMPDASLLARIAAARALTYREREQVARRGERAAKSLERAATTKSRR